MHDRQLQFRQSKIYLYGAGKIGHEVVKKIGYEVAGIFDKNYKQLQCLDNILIMNPIDIMKLNPENSILIFSVGMDVASLIMPVMEKLGWTRNINYFYYLDFIQHNLAEYLFWKKGEVYVQDFTISITTKCSLKCKNCSQQLYRIKNRVDRSIDELKTDLIKIFEHIDYIDSLAIIGGEPFTHQKLDVFLKELVRYRKKYGNCRVVTNATILPSSDILMFMKEHDICLELTKYSLVQSKIEAIIHECEEFHVPYVVNEHEYWLNMWDAISVRSDDEGEWLFKNCVTNNHCAGMVNGFITACTCSFMYMLGENNVFEDDSLDLYQIQSKENVFRYLSGNIKCLEGCKRCNGLYGVNDRKILPGEQLE